MKLAVTDTCIFIDLFVLQFINQFFKLDIEVHTTVDVYNELNDTQRQVLDAYIQFNKLYVHEITEEDRINIFSQSYPNSLSETDKSVLYLAKRLDALVISSDGVVRNFAKQKSIEYHGILWIFDRLLDLEIISTVLATEKLSKLTDNNFFYQNNNELMNEINKRLGKWSN